MTPNLFDFATSELSQDAFLCWLLSWARPAHRETHPALHAVARALLDDCYRRAGASLPEHLSRLEIRRQDGGIDILCIVNAEWAILIEDKAGTQQHSGQLARYQQHVIDKLGFSMPGTLPGIPGKVFTRHSSTSCGMASGITSRIPRAASSASGGISAGSTVAKSTCSSNRTSSASRSMWKMPNGGGNCASTGTSAFSKPAANGDSGLAGRIASGTVST